MIHRFDSICRSRVLSHTHLAKKSIKSVLYSKLGENTDFEGELGADIQVSIKALASSVSTLISKEEPYIPTMGQFRTSVTARYKTNCSFLKRHTTREIIYGVQISQRG